MANDIDSMLETCQAERDRWLENLETGGGELEHEQIRRLIADANRARRIEESVEGYCDGAYDSISVTAAQDWFWGEDDA